MSGMILYRTSLSGVALVFGKEVVVVSDEL